MRIVLCRLLLPSVHHYVYCCIAYRYTIAVRRHYKRFPQFRKFTPVRYGLTGWRNTILRWFLRDEVRTNRLGIWRSTQWPCLGLTDRSVPPCPSVSFWSTPGSLRNYRKTLSIRCCDTGALFSSLRCHRCNVGSVHSPWWCCRWRWCFPNSCDRWPTATVDTLTCSSHLFATQMRFSTMGFHSMNSSYSHRKSRLYLRMVTHTLLVSHCHWQLQQYSTRQFHWLWIVVEPDTVWQYLGCGLSHLIRYYHPYPITDIAAFCIATEPRLYELLGRFPQFRGDALN